MAAPLLQAQIDIDAPVERVWSLICDLSRMPEWSPQCRLMKVLGPMRAGARTVNLNRRKFMFWPTTARIVEFIPQHKLAFRIDISNVIWTYELERTETGTRVVESRHAENGTSAVTNTLINTFMGGVSGFEDELVDGMNASLARIKAAAER